jgi:hypothetical protein
MSRSDFRDCVPTLETSKIHGGTAREHANKVLNRPSIKVILDGWQKLYAASYKGMTLDGEVIQDLFNVRSELAPTEQAIIATNHLIGLLTADQLRVSSFEIFSKQWRNWQNTEIYMEDYGLRLAEVSKPVRDAILEVMRVCLSQKGYQKTRNIMCLNGFLGDLVGGPDIFGEFTYIFNLFSKPSAIEPWGWQLFGHHLCLNCLILKDQMTITPTFMGGEPCNVDEGPHNGLSIFDDEERLGLELMQSLSKSQKNQALVAHSMVGGDLPEGRRVLHDGLHLGGAYCDNRIVPYEGLRGIDFSSSQRDKLFELISEYLGTLPKGPFEAKIKDIEDHFNDTHFCWIGGQRDNQPFYYRIQSPVTLIEFDHHAGVFLDNSEPQNFHVHTLVRTPNGNDYGADLIRQHYHSSPHHEQHDHNRIK